MPAFAFCFSEPEKTVNIDWSIYHIKASKNIKPPVQNGQRALNTRYHLWFICISRCRPHGVQQRLSLLRATPSFPTELFQESHSGRYFSAFSRCLAPTGSSLAENGSLTYSHLCVIGDILTKCITFVKYFQNNTCFQCIEAGANYLTIYFFSILV